MFKTAFVMTLMLASPPVHEVVIVSADQLAAHRINIPVGTTRPQPLTRDMGPVENHEVMFSKEKLGAALLFAQKLGQAHPRFRLYMSRSMINSMEGREICLPYDQPMTNASKADHAYTAALYQVLDENPDYWNFQDGKSCILVVPKEAHDPMFVDLADKALGNNYRKYVPTS
jgi:hypothetical protein